MRWKEIQWFNIEQLVKNAQIISYEIKITMLQVHVAGNQKLDIRDTIRSFDNENDITVSVTFWMDKNWVYRQLIMQLLKFQNLAL